MATIPARGSQSPSGRTASHESTNEAEDEALLEPASPPLHPSLREISALASWTVSSYKPGCGVDALLSPSTALFWQSDGPQPHLLTIHFFKVVMIVRLRLYLDFELDESYTPTRLAFAAGMGEYDLVEFAEWRGESPRGWVEVGLEGCGGESRTRTRTGTGRPKGPKSSAGAHGQPTAAAIAATSAAAGAAATGASGVSGHGHGYENGKRGGQEAGNGTEFGGVSDFTPHSDQDSSDDDDYADYGNGDAAAAAEDPSSPEFAGIPGSTGVLRCMCVQIRVLENHQNGKDTHIRGVQLFSRDERIRRTPGGPSHHHHHHHQHQQHHHHHDHHHHQHHQQQHQQHIVETKVPDGRGGAGGGGAEGEAEANPGIADEIGDMFQPDWIGDPEIR